METNKKGKICLYCFLVVAAILGIIAFILTLTKKCGEGFNPLDKLYNQSENFKTQADEHSNEYNNICSDCKCIGNAEISPKLTKSELSNLNSNELNIYKKSICYDKCKCSINGGEYDAFTTEWEKCYNCLCPYGCKNSQIIEESNCLDNFNKFINDNPKLQNYDCEKIVIMDHLGARLDDVRTSWDMNNSIDKSKTILYSEL